MTRMLFFQLAFIIFAGSMVAQPTGSLLNKNDLSFLSEITKAVLDSARIFPGDVVSDLSGPNNTGGVVIRPGGRNDYPAFWIRDYAMSLETRLVPVSEQKHLLLLTAAGQCDQTMITKLGALIPVGAIPDHIRVDNSLPIYFPGTYDYEEQGDPIFGNVPPYCDQCYFIHMAHYYIITSGDTGILLRQVNGTRLIDRLETAFKTVPCRPGSQLVYTSASFRGVDFGFRDGIQITGDLCFASVLKYHAAIQLALLFEQLKDEKKAGIYRKIARQIKQALPTAFLGKDGLLRASTGWSNQPDVWASALAVYFDVLEGDTKTEVCRALADAYLAGTIAYKGNIRHVPTDKDYNANTAWEKTGIEKNTYQNGAYWGTPTGWVCYAIAMADRVSARKLAGEFIADLRANDFRKGAAFGAPYECFYPPDYHQNPLYLTTVACPLIVFKSSF